MLLADTGCDLSLCLSLPPTIFPRISLVHLHASGPRVPGCEPRSRIYEVRRELVDQLLPQETQASVYQLLTLNLAPVFAPFRNSFPPPDFVVEAAREAVLRNDCNQYSHPKGRPRLRNVSDRALAVGHRRNFLPSMLAASPLQLPSPCFFFSRVAYDCGP